MHQFDGSEGLGWFLYSYPKEDTYYGGYDFFEGSPKGEARVQIELMQKERSQSLDEFISSINPLDLFISEPELPLPSANNDFLFDESRLYEFANGTAIELFITEPNTNYVVNISTGGFYGEKRAIITSIINSITFLDKNP